MGQTFVDLFGYKMSFLESVGTFFNLASVWLASRGKISNWPTGIVGALLFALLFYQLRLYADFFEQIYFIGASLYGWRLWKTSGVQNHVLRVRYSSGKIITLCLVMTASLGTLCALFMTRIHLLWPALFPEPASLPWADGLTTIASIIAMLLMARGRIEAWLYWIAIDLVSVSLYAAKAVYFVSALYGLYLVLAVWGWRQWLNMRRRG